ncbi:ImmA/IrrE family metallo-endopeptidase [Niallia taxi]|uniref:ImmA/IrrE family metallo-endopeptidase n=1 Tax=Niallia taxi TaxID=2499688 RepID=UPI003F604F29
MLDTLIVECNEHNVEVYEEHMKGSLKGLYANNVIWINKKIKNSVEKICIVAEELGHYHTSSGDILDQTSTSNRKQELIARGWAYKRLIPFDKLLQAKKEGITNRYELAEYLQVTEEFLQSTLNRYKEKYGQPIMVNGMMLYFDPLDVSY